MKLADVKVGAKYIDNFYDIPVKVLEVGKRGVKVRYLDGDGRVDRISVLSLTSLDDVRSGRYKPAYEIVVDGTIVKVRKGKR